MPHSVTYIKNYLKNETKMNGDYAVAFKGYP